LQLAQQVGDVFMFGSDYPHPEGLANPVIDFARATGAPPADHATLWASNAAHLISAT
jgi:predicted TIM-barrel fold metal-dependent hydrolase